MPKTDRMLSAPLPKQRGFVFKLIHALLIVLGVVTLIVLYKAGKIPFINYRPSAPDWIRFPAQETSRPLSFPQQQRHSTETVTRQREDDSYDRTRFAVQVAAGYDSRQLYAWRDALLDDGYDAYLVSLNTPRGLMFKLRVGAYTSRTQAEAMRDKIARRYPMNFGDSFVVEGY